MAALDDFASTMMAATASVSLTAATRLQASATNEAMRLLDDATLTVDALPAVADQSIVLLVQADYDGDPEKRPAYRRAAEQLIYSYRSLGIK